MKTKILNSEEITKEMAINSLHDSNDLSQEERDEFLDIISAINDGQFVYNLTTNKGEYLLFIDGDSIKNTKEKHIQHKK